MEKDQNDPKATNDASGLYSSQLPPFMTNESATDRGNTSLENREEEIVALRGWDLVVDSDSRYVLKSPGRGPVLWPKLKPLKAECIPPYLHGKTVPSTRRTRTRHESPGLRCWCGAYGLKVGVREALGTVAGEVYLFGEYVEHDLGYRAQYAYPKNLTWFRCSSCGENYRMNDLDIVRKSGTYPQMRLPQVCKSCLDRWDIDRYGTETDLIPLSYVIEEIEYQYNLEVF